MEAIFEYEINGVTYTEDNPPQKFIDDLSNALKLSVIPILKGAD